MLNPPYAYHVASPESIHSPVHGSIAVYTKIPNFGSRYIGTLSGIVIERSSRKKYLLSNQHVFFPYQSKSPAVKPTGGLSVYMTGDASKPIGKTYKTKAEKNPWPKSDRQKALDTLGPYHDSALATASVPVSNVVNQIGAQRGMIEPKAGMRIKYYGRTSRLQKGTITKPDVNNVNANIPGDKIQVQKHVIFADIASAAGDSGSMVFNDDNRVVGVLFAETITGGTTLICRASAIENAYGVVFSEDELGGGGTTPKPEPTPKPTPKPTPIPGIDFSDRTTQLLLVGGGIFVVMLIAGLSAK